MPSAISFSSATVLPASDVYWRKIYDKGSLCEVFISSQPLSHIRMRKCPPTLCVCHSTCFPVFLVFFSFSFLFLLLLFFVLFFLFLSGSSLFYKTCILHSFTSFLFLYHSFSILVIFVSFFRTKFFFISIKLIYSLSSSFPSFCLLFPSFSLSQVLQFDFIFFVFWQPFFFFSLIFLSSFFFSLHLFVLFNKSFFFSFNSIFLSF